MCQNFFGMLATPSWRILKLLESLLHCMKFNETVLYPISTKTHEECKQAFFCSGFKQVSCSSSLPPRCSSGSTPASLSTARASTRTPRNSTATCYWRCWTSFRRCSRGPGPHSRTRAPRGWTSASPSSRQTPPSSRFSSRSRWSPSSPRSTSPTASTARCRSPSSISSTSSPPSPPPPSPSPKTTRSTSSSSATSSASPPARRISRPWRRRAVPSTSPPWRASPGRSCSFSCC